MKLQIRIVLALMITLLMPLGAASAGDGAARKVTGGVQGWSPMGYAWTVVDVHEVVPGGATGSVSMKLYNEELGWRRWKAHPICIAFGEGLDGEPAASIVLQVDSISGWGYGEVGQYIKGWASDGGTPASEGDLLGIVVYFKDKQPGCGYKRAKTIWTQDGGDLTVHD